MSSQSTRNAKRKAIETASGSSQAWIFSDNESSSQTANQRHVDSDSDLSTSSEEPSEDSSCDSDDEDSDAENDSINSPNEGIINVRPGTKPKMKLGTPQAGLLQRLKTFLPELEAANERLDKERLDGTIEQKKIEIAEEGDGPYIELELGLGVLEEKSNDITVGREVDGLFSDKRKDYANGHKESQESDIINELMGQARNHQRPKHIQELGKE